MVDGLVVGGQQVGSNVVSGLVEGLLVGWWPAVGGSVEDLSVGRCSVVLKYAQILCRHLHISHSLTFDSLFALSFLSSTFSFAEKTWHH